LYNHITLALKDSHPSDWMEHQLKVHELFSDMLDLNSTEEDEIVEVHEEPILIEDEHVS